MKLPWSSPSYPEVPGNWLKKDTAVTSWHIASGIYSDWEEGEHSPWILTFIVYETLKDVPEAERELRLCHEKYASEIAPKIIAAGHKEKNAVEKRTKKSGVLDIGKILGGLIKHTNPVSDKKITSIFKSWVDKWAAGSDRMMKVVVCDSTWRHVCEPLGLKSKNLVQKNGKPTKALLEFAVKSDPDTADVWRMLLSGEAKRAENELRRMRKQTVRASGFTQREEAPLIVASHYWVMVRIFNWTETQLIEHISITQDVHKYIQNISSVIIPFDRALGTVQKPGAPPGKKRIFAYYKKYL